MACFSLGTAQAVPDEHLGWATLLSLSPFLLGSLRGQQAPGAVSGYLLAIKKLMPLFCPVCSCFSSIFAGGMLRDRNGVN